MRKEAVDPGDTLAIYLDQQGITPLLTREQEICCAKSIARAEKAARKIIRGKTCTEEELTLIKEGQNAQQTMIKANTRLVISVAYKYIGRGMPFLDLIQEGNLGLIKAVVKFDPDRGTRFGTHATWWIRDAVTKALKYDSRAIRIPADVSGKIRKIAEISNRLAQKLGSQPTMEQIAQEMGVSPEKVEEVLQVSKIQPKSLDAPDESGRSLYDFIDAEAPSTEEVATDNLNRTRIKEILDGIITNLHHRQVLDLRYGLTTRVPLSMKEVGKKLGIKKQRVWEIETEYRKKLKDPENAKLFKPYYEKE